jgi:hypothetical protein
VRMCVHRGECALIYVSVFASVRGSHKNRTKTRIAIFLESQYLEN